MNAVNVTIAELCSPVRDFPNRIDKTELRLGRSKRRAIHHRPFRRLPYNKNDAIKTVRYISYVNIYWYELTVDEALILSVREIDCGGFFWQILFPLILQQRCDPATLFFLDK